MAVIGKKQAVTKLLNKVIAEEISKPKFSTLFEPREDNKHQDKWKFGQQLHQQQNIKASKINHMQETPNLRRKISSR